MALNVVMFGPPGAGKGIQASRLGAARGIPKISTGDILREAVQAGTELGRAAKAIIDRGELVSDEIVVGIVRERLAKGDVQDGFILDGFPRTVAQASALDEMLKARDPLIIIELAVPDEELVQRLSRRRVCGRCGAVYAARDAEPPTTCTTCGGDLVLRSDDREDVVRERLAVYQRQTRPLVEFYQTRRSFGSVDGNQTPDVVEATVGTAVDAAMAARGRQPAPAGG